MVTNGHVDDNREDSPYQSPPLMWRNQEGRFTILTDRLAGGYFTGRHVGRGLVVADLDDDLDPDIVIGHQDSAPALLRNDHQKINKIESSFLVVQLVGTVSNRDAIGSSVILRSGDRSMQQQVKGGGSYLSASELKKRFAVLAGEENLEIEIRWPGRNRSVISDIVAGRRYVVVEPTEPDLPPRVMRFGP